MTNNCPDGMCGADDCLRCRPEGNWNQAPADSERKVTELADAIANRTEADIKGIIESYGMHLHLALSKLIDPSRRSKPDLNSEDITAAITLIDEIFEAVEAYEP